MKAMKAGPTARQNVRMTAILSLSELFMHGSLVARIDMWRELWKCLIFSYTVFSLVAISVVAGFLTAVTGTGYFKL